MKLTYTRKNGDTFEFDPEDRRDRLTVADAMQEDGDLRGELIGLINKREALGYPPAKEKEREEVSRAIRDIMGRINSEAGNNYVSYYPGNGLLRVSLEFPTWEVLQDLSRQRYFDLVTDLHLRRTDIEAILSNGILRQISDLTIISDILEGIEALTSSSQISNLKRLCIGLSDLKGGEFHLSHSPYLRNLVYLNLSRCGIDGVGAEALAQTQCMPNLEGLVLSGNRIGRRGLRAFAQTSTPERLESLCLGMDDVETKDINEIQPIVDAVRDRGIIILWSRYYQQGRIRWVY